MQVFEYKEFRAALTSLRRRGGSYDHAADKAIVFADTLQNDSQGMKYLPVSNHGESCIDIVVEYLLNIDCRLVTVQDSGYVFLCYVGTHDECDKWMISKAGMTIRIEPASNAIVTFESFDMSEPDQRIESKVCSISEPPLPLLDEKLQMEVPAEAPAQLDMAESSSVFEHGEIMGTPRPRGRPSKATAIERRNSEVEEQSAPAFSSLKEFVGHLWTRLEADELEILQGRWGYVGKVLTLDEIGRSRGVSRARIGQIEGRAITNKLRMWPRVNAMLARLQGLESQRNLPIPLGDLFMFDSWFDHESTSDHGFRHMLKALSNERICVVDIEEIPYLMPFTRKQWEAHVSEARALLSDLAKIDSLITDVDDHLSKILPLSASKYAGLLTSGISELQIARGKDDQMHLVAYGDGVKELLKVVLFEAEEPLHLTEIVKRVRDRSPRDYATSVITNGLPGVGLILGRGAYGLRHHIPLSDAEIAELVLAAEEVVLSDVARQWSTTELCYEVTARGLFANDALDKYILGACLRSHSRNLADVGRGVWAGTGGLGTNDRIQIRDRILQLLVDAGRPLSTEELKASLVATRGLTATFQIQPRDPLFRLGTARWGLLDRDLEIPISDTVEHLDELKAELLRTGKGIHVSEVIAVLKQAGLNVSWIHDPEILLALATRNRSMKVTQSRYLCLPDWPNEQRVLPAQAVLDAFTVSPRSGSDDLALIASANAERPITSDVVRGVMNDNDYRFDRSEGVWKKAKESEYELA